MVFFVTKARIIKMDAILLLFLYKHTREFGALKMSNGRKVTKDDGRRLVGLSWYYHKIRW
jgi:hypothetical protein